MTLATITLVAYVLAAYITGVSLESAVIAALYSVAFVFAINMKEQAK